MKKKFLTAILTIMMCCVSGRSYAESDTSVLWGIKASVDAELPGKWRGERVSYTMFRPGYGFNIGAVANIYIARNFYFEPGVSLFHSDYRYKDLVIMEDGNGSDVTTDPNVTKWGFQVPLVFGYSFTFPMNIYTGPQLRYAFAGEIEIDKNKIEGVETEFDLWRGQRRFDLSWKIGVGFPVNNFNVAFEADLGVTDLMKGDMSFRENRVGLAVTYYF